MQNINPTTLIMLVTCAIWAAGWATKHAIIAIYKAGVRRGSDLVLAQGEADPEKAYIALLESANKKRTLEVEGLLKSLTPDKKAGKSKLSLFAHKH